MVHPPYHLRLSTEYEEIIPLNGKIIRRQADIYNYNQKPDF